jgi:AcrR family transcriptional regulator
VYRHFADKNALIETAIQDELESMAALAEERLAADSGWDGLNRFPRKAIARQVAHRGLRDAFPGSCITQGPCGVPASASIHG